ncbi:hypothetical protein ARMGADRAFT_1032504 [Armillaria gallica]|uniref:Uncharacterized protein n=1 Tax=Armillaria gallica TaxID=47427 RepID=A0A2H3DN41_ARMGA|nr:hypothetical protein ARMGADRAFT_1032504 [Armillaria gallica]
MGTSEREDHEELSAKPSMKEDPFHVIYSHGLGDTSVRDTRLHLEAECSDAERETFGNLLNGQDAMLLVYKGEVLLTGRQNNHVAVLDRVTTWRSTIIVPQSHAWPVNPFDSQNYLLAILNNRPYIPHEAPDGAPTLDTCEYDWWFLLTILGKPHYDDKKVSKERNIHWHRMCQDPHHELEDWAEFLHRKKDDKAQHHRASHDEPANSIYVNMSPAGPSGLTTTMPSLSYPPPPPHHWHQAYEGASLTSQPPTLAYTPGYSGWFGPPS